MLYIYKRILANRFIINKCYSINFKIFKYYNNTLYIPIFQIGLIDPFDQEV